MREIKCDQGSAAWLDARRGRITASRIAEVMDYLKKGGEGASRRNYRAEILAERLTGRSEEHYVSPEMDHGTECEPYARAAYEIAHDVMVDQVGFVLHPQLDFTGASADGLVDDDGLIEIKAPKTTTHLKWLQAGVVPEEHYDQIQWNLCCTEREYADFVSYDPRLPQGLKILIVRVPRDNDRIVAIENEVLKFNDEVDTVIAKLTGQPSRLSFQLRESIADTRTPLEQLEALMDAEIVP